MKIRPAMFRFAEVDLCVDGGEVRRLRVMIPHRRFAELCKRQFDVGEDYALGPVEGVSSRSRAPLFIAAQEAWKNLPEEDKRFPTWEHVRHQALVEAGWAHHTHVVMDTPEDAKTHAKGLRKVGEYAVIAVNGRVVDCWVPKSIGAGQINGEEWKTVRDAALNWIATLARTTKAALEKHVEEGGAS